MADNHPIDFLTTNPAMDAFQRGQEQAQRVLLNDASIEAAQRGNAEAKLSQGSRLRTIDANADTAVAGAKVATGTADSKIANEANNARTSGATADVAQGTVGSRIANSANTARSSGAAADVAVGTVAPRIQQAQDAARTSGAGADVAVATVPDRIAQSGAQTRTALSNADVTEATQPDRIQQSHDTTRRNKAGADSAEMQSFDKVLGLIKAGDIEGAKAYAERAGANVPAELFNNAQVQRHMVDAWDKANQMYPDRPKERLSAMKGYLKHMADVAAQGGQTTSADVYNIPGAPEPPEFAGKTNEHKSAEIQKVEWLIKNKVAKDAQEAWTLAHQTLQNPQSVYAQIYNNHIRINGGDTAKAQTDTEAAVKMLRSMTPQPGAQPAPAPAPTTTSAAAIPPRPQNVPPGSQYSPSRGMWRDPRGNIYGPDGTPARL